MVMEQDERVGDSLGMQDVAHRDQIGSGEAELGILASACRPLTGTLGEQSHSGTDHRFHADLFGDGEDLMEFLKLLNDEDHFLAELQAEQRGPDELVVLVAVTHDKALGIGMDRKRRDHLRFTARLDAEMILLARVDDLLDDLAKLVDLDRENAAVGVLVAALLDGLGKRLIQATDTIAKKIMATNQKGETQPSILGLSDQFHQVDLLTLAAPRPHGGMSRRVHDHVSLRPSLHVVERRVLLGNGEGIVLRHFLSGMN